MCTTGSVMTISRIGSGPGLPAGFPFSLASEANGIFFGAKVELQAVAARGR